MSIDSLSRRSRFAAGVLAFLALAVLTPVAALAQDGYVSLRDLNQVLVLDPADTTDVGTRVVFTAKTNGLAVSPDGTEVYVIEGAGLRRISGGVLQPTGTFAVSLGGVPEQAAVSPDGSKVYVTNFGTNTRVHIINTSLTGTAARTNVDFVPGDGAWGVAAVTTGSGDRAYVTLSVAGQVKVFDIGSTNGATIDATIILPAGAQPNGVAASPLGDFVYVANFSGDSVFKIDTATNAVVATIPVGDGPQELTVNADGTLVYVTLRNDGEVDVIDTATNTVTDTVDLGGGPDQLRGISFSADGQFVVVAHFGTNKVSAIEPDNANAVSTTAAITNAAPRYVAFQPLAPVVPPDDPPVFTLPLCVPIDATLGVEVAVPISVTDDTGATVTLSENPVTGGLLDAPFPLGPTTPVTNTFRWTPTAANAAGAYDLTFTATDASNPAVECLVTINVPAPPDLPPTLISPACGQTLTPELGDTVDFTIDAGDDGGATFSVDGLPAGASMDPELPLNGTDMSADFSWTPTAADAGTHVVTFTVDDGVNDPVSCTVTIVVPEAEDTEFDGFRLKLAKVSTRGRYADVFWFNGTFKVDLENGDDINPAEEDTVLGIEDGQWTIPAGEFESKWRGRLFRFRGTVNGTKLMVHIVRLGREGSGRYNVNVTGWNGTLNASNPLQMCLAIGDDFGCDSKFGRIH